MVNSSDSDFSLSVSFLSQARTLIPLHLHSLSVGPTAVPLPGIWFGDPLQSQLAYMVPSVFLHPPPYFSIRALFKDGDLILTWVGQITYKNLSSM